MGTCDWLSLSWLLTSCWLLKVFSDAVCFDILLISFPVAERWKSTFSNNNSFICKCFVVSLLITSSPNRDLKVLAKAVKQFACCLFQVEGSIQKYCSAWHRSQDWKLKCLLRVKLVLKELTSRVVRFFFYHCSDSVTVILANLEVSVKVTVWAIGNIGL